MHQATIIKKKGRIKPIIFCKYATPMIFFQVFGALNHNSFLNRKGTGGEFWMTAILKHDDSFLLLYNVILQKLLDFETDNGYFSFLL